MREATWNKIGTDVTGARLLDEVLERANLNYKVEKRPIFLADGTEIPNQKATVRVSDGHPYGVVSDRYNVVQNRSAFEFIDYINSDLVLEKAGETQKGLVYIIGRLPDVNVLGDTFTPHLIFRNNFAGRFTISAAICPLRIVCQNQFNFAFKHSANTITIRHNSRAEERLIAARDTLKSSHEYMTRLTQFAEKYAKKGLTDWQVRKVMDIMFPVGEDVTPRTLLNIQTARDRFLQAYESGDNSNFRGTAWGLINAYTDYKTHQEIRGNETQKRLETRFVKTTMTRPMDNIVDVIDAVA